MVALETALSFGMKRINAGFVTITMMATFILQGPNILKVPQVLGGSTIKGIFRNLAFVAWTVPLKDWVVKMAVNVARILLFISTRISVFG
jgi:hypothetical protein